MSLEHPWHVLKKKGWWHPNVYHTQNLNYNNWVDHKSCQPTNSTTWSYKHVCFLGVSSTWIPKVMTWSYGSYLHPPTKLDLLWFFLDLYTIVGWLPTMLSKLVYIDATSLDGSLILGIIGFPTFNHFLGFDNSRIAPCCVHSGN
jgi:hypothetical protein